MWNLYSAMDLTFFVEVLSSFNVQKHFLMKQLSLNLVKYLCECGFKYHEPLGARGVGMKLCHDCIVTLSGKQTGDRQTVFCK